MSTKTKTIHFFRLDMYKLDLDEKGNSVQRFLTSLEKEMYLKDLIQNKLSDRKAIQVEKYNSTSGNNTATVEIVSENENYVFGKMGKEQDINNYQLRKNETLASSPITKGPDQFFEAFSYFMIDRRTFAVSYIMERSAPSIVFLGDMFTQVFKETDKLWGITLTIVSKDSLNKLAGKDIIGSIYYDVTIPRGSHKDVTGMNEEDYELLQNEKHTKVQVKLVADKRKKSMFKTSDMAKKFFSSIAGKTDNVTIKAKDENESIMQEYRLFDDIMSKKASFIYDSSKTSEEFEKTIEDQIWLKYQQNRPEILEYVGFDCEEE